MGKREVANGASKVIVMRLLKLLHSLIVFALFCVCWFLFYRTEGIKPAYVRYNPLICAAYLVIHLSMYRIYQAYVIGYNRKTEIVYSQSLADLISVGIIWVLDMMARSRWINPVNYLALLAVQMVINIIWANVAQRVYFKVNSPRRTILIYRNNNDLERLREVYRFPEKFNVEKTLENPADFEEIREAVEGFEAIVVAGIPASLQNGVAKYCIQHSVYGYMAPHIGDIIMMGANHVRQFSVPIINVRGTNPSPEYLILKRLFDIIVSLILIAVLSPLMLVIGIAVKICDGGPVLYKQVRLTRGGKKFRILKFRSMRTDAEKDGVARLSTGEKDSRITPVGRIIRACRLDELPQLFNILGGSMSFVGPRPERPEIAEQYQKQIPFDLRLQVKAGLTGYAQIYGKYNTNPYDKLQLDLIYINRMSIFEDMILMFATVAVLFKKESTEGIREGGITAASPDGQEISVPDEDKENAKDTRGE
ncbi:MAG: exopolysaccharide biosynthesis polyprenyl glycosylphosphotransferase [Clostridia bacterium]|nr:exopolysaccharide biosynthesis polyprenyl glycosylphosphotransferase [Clostridia bacterium]